MQQNLQAWMDQFAGKFMQPNLVAMQQPTAAPRSAAPPSVGAVTAPPVQQSNLVAQGQQPPVAQAPAVPPSQPGTPVGDADVDQSFEGLFRQMPEKEQDSTVDDLEKQVGDINKAYDNMQEQLGQRPDTRLSRREKGMLIMEFGLQLMSQSGADKHGGDIGGAVGDAGLATMDSYRGLMKEKQGQGEAWDTTQRNLTAGRVKDVGVARKDGMAVQRQERQDRISQDRADEAARHNREIEGQGQQRLTNLEDWRDTQVDKGIGAGRRSTGGAGGAGGGRPTANVQNINDLVKRGIPEDLAVRLVYRRIEDPRKAWKELYDSRRKTFSSEADAKQEADDIIGMLYGRDAIPQAGEPFIPKTKLSAEPVPVNSQEEYDALEPGQVYIDPKGKKRRKQ